MSQEPEFTHFPYGMLARVVFSFKILYFLNHKNRECVPCIYDTSGMPEGMMMEMNIWDKQEDDTFLNK